MPPVSHRLHPSLDLGTRLSWMAWGLACQSVPSCVLGPTYGSFLTSPSSFFSALCCSTAFRHAVDWNERWIQGVLAFHVALWLFFIVTRKSFGAQVSRWPRVPCHYRRRRLTQVRLLLKQTNRHRTLFARTAVRSHEVFVAVARV